MNKLYIITGPAGVGKSTISKQIAERSTKSVLIEGDEIYHHVVGGYISPWLEGNHLEVFWKACMSLIDIYLENEYDVVFNYIIDDEELTIFKEKYKDIDKKFVCLIVDEETILKRDKERPEDCQMKERCIILLNSFKNKTFDKKYFLDTSNLTIEDTVNEIETNEQYNL